MNCIQKSRVWLACATFACVSAFVWGGPSIDYSKRQVGFGKVAEYEIPYRVPSTEEVMSEMDLIFKYTDAVTTLKVFDNKTGKELADPALLTEDAVVDQRFGGYNNWDYTNGVIIAAFDQLGEMTGDPKYFDYNQRFYDFVFTWMPAFRAREENGGKRSPYYKMVNMYALDHCGSITAALIKTQMRDGDPRFREWIDVVDDFIANGQFRLDDGTLARERPQAVSVWTDDFYMSIPFLAQMGRLTGEKKYYDDAVRQVVQMSAYLFDENEGLYDHGWSEVTDPYDPRHYWGRANGWAAMAMTELLTVLPEDHEGRDEVLHIYRSHIRGIVERQDGSGLWRNLLDKESTYLETSASSMFVFAIARGINEGWLEALYAPVAVTGWNGVASRILPDGRVEGICQGTTYANDGLYYWGRGAGEHTNFFGAVLLAGAETVRLLENPVVKITAPKPNAVNSAMHGTPRSAE